MSKFAIRIKDRQTGRSETIWIEANSRNEAKDLACHMRLLAKYQAIKQQRTEDPNQISGPFIFSSTAY